MFRLLSAAAALTFVVGGVVVNMTPALAVSQPTRHAAQTAATPVAAQPAQRQTSTAPAAAPVKPQAPVEPKVAAPVAPMAKPVAPVTQVPVEAPVVEPVTVTPTTQPTQAPPGVDPIASAPPVKKVDEGQKPVSTPTPESVKFDKGQSEHVSSTPAPVAKRDTGKVSTKATQPTPQTQAAKTVDQPSCGKSDISGSKLHRDSNSYYATFTVSDGCHVLISLISNKSTGKDYFPQVLVSQVTGDYGPGSQRTDSVPVGTNASHCQEDLAVGPALPTIGSGHFYGSRLLTSAAGSCVEQSPPPPPVVVPPPGHYPCGLGIPEVNGVCQSPQQPVKQVLCGPNETRVGEKCITNSTPPRASQPPVITPTIPQAPVSQPQRLVASQTLAVRPTISTTPIRQTPSAPDTGQGTEKLANTGAGANPWLLAGLVFVLAGLLAVRLLNKVERKEEEESR